MKDQKYNFIQELLSDSNISIQQRDRIIKLSLNEVKNNVENRKLLNTRNNKINNKSQNKLDSNQITNEKESINIINYKSPKHLAKFLLDYNQDPILMYTCHLIGSDALDLINEICETNKYDYNKHIQAISNSFDKLAKKHPEVKDTFAFTLIKTFLFGSKPWSIDGIQTNWNSNGIKEWVSKHPNFPPNLSRKLADKNKISSYKFPRFTTKITGKKIRNFQQLTFHYKYLFHIRRENSLYDIIKFKNEIENWNDKIDFSFKDFSKDIVFFTDVDKLLQAYKRIILMIKDEDITPKDIKPRINLSLKEDNEFVLFGINHLNSKYNKTLNSTIYKPIGDRYEQLIVKQIKGLCDLILNANFGEQSATVNLFDGKKTRPIVHDIPFEGVEHVFKFYRK